MAVLRVLAGLIPVQNPPAQPGLARVIGRTAGACQHDHGTTEDTEKGGLHFVIASLRRMVAVTTAFMRGVMRPDASKGQKGRAGMRAVPSW